MQNNERVAIFIDGSNLYYSLKKYHLKIMIEDIIKILARFGHILDIFYYTARLDPEFDNQRYLKHEKFLVKLSKIDNLKVVLCNLKKTFYNKEAHYLIKRDDIKLANDILVGAYEDLYDLAIIVSGDEDFVPVINTARRLGKKVINAYFPKTSSYLLRVACNYSINLKREIRKSKGGKPPRTIINNKSN
jgi:uncharacterized LabA/DUF88 family protein